MGAVWRVATSELAVRFRRAWLVLAGGAEVGITPVRSASDGPGSACRCCKAGLPTSTVLLLAVSLVPSSPSDSPSSLSAPLAAPESGPSAPVAIPSGLAAPPAPLVAGVEPSVPAPGPDPAPSALPAMSAPVVAQSAPGIPAALPAAVVLPAAIPAVAQSLLEVSATTGGPAPLVAPSTAGPFVPAVAPMAPAGQPSRPQSPDRRPSCPHSPAPHQDRSSSRRRRDSPRRYQQQPHWAAHPGCQGDWRGYRGRGGGGGYRPPVTMADLQREVSRAVREEKVSQSQSSSMRTSPVLEVSRQPALPLSPPPVAAPPLQFRLLQGVEFVAAGGGASAAPYLHRADGDQPLLFLAEALEPPQTRVPEATLGQLHRLAESLNALLLIQVVAHSSLPVVPPESFRGRQRDTCLDAADQLAVLLAPVLAAPAEGGAAAAGQLDDAVWGLRRHLRAGSGAAAIGASTLVVRELWRSLTGVLHALGAHRM
ncbi:unnamed protein product [Closterium sp. NIES-54]